MRKAQEAKRQADANRKAEEEMRRADANRKAEELRKARAKLLRWQFQTGGRVTSSPAIGSDGTVYVGSHEKLCAINGKSGVKLWEFEMDEPGEFPVIGADGTVYIGSEDKKLYALDGKTGAKKWEFEMGAGDFISGVSGSPAIGTDGTVYILSWDEKLYALDGKTGAKIWEFLFHEWGGGSPTIGLDEEANTPYMVGSFACTPIAKFPLTNIKDGGQIKGTSVLELGSGNRPLDMFTYSSGGKQWLVTHTMRFHKPFVYTPSKYWAARIDMKHIAASTKDKTNEKAARRNKGVAQDPQGIEVVKALHGAVQVDKYGDKQAAVLREAEGNLNLEVVDLP